MNAAWDPAAIAQHNNTNSSAVAAAGGNAARLQHSPRSAPADNPDGDDLVAHYVLAASADNDDDDDNYENNDTSSAASFQHAFVPPASAADDDQEDIRYIRHNDIATFDELAFSNDEETAENNVPPAHRNHAAQLRPSDEHDASPNDLGVVQPLGIGYELLAPLGHRVFRSPVQHQEKDDSADSDHDDRGVLNNVALTDMAAVSRLAALAAADLDARERAAAAAADDHDDNGDAAHDDDEAEILQFDGFQSFSERAYYRHIANGTLGIQHSSTTTSAASVAAPSTVLSSRESPTSGNSSSSSSHPTMMTSTTTTTTTTITSSSSLLQTLAEAPVRSATTATATTASFALFPPSSASPVAAAAANGSPQPPIHLPLVAGAPHPAVVPTMSSLLDETDRQLAALASLRSDEESRRTDNVYSLRTTALTDADVDEIKSVMAGVTLAGAPPPPWVMSLGRTSAPHHLPK